MRRALLSVLGFLAAAALGRADLLAQGLPAAPSVNRLAIVVADGRVYVYPSRVPAEGEGWIVSRDGVRLTSAPLTGVQGPAEFSAAIGSDLALIERITSTETSVGAYRRLRAGGTAAGIAQVLSPRTAAALGALFVDSTAAPGATHTYEAELVRLSRPDSVLRKASGTVRVATMSVPTTGAVTARAVDGVISLSWSPPRFTGASNDIVVAYTIERADSVGAFARISELPVMRLADRPSAHQDDAVVPGRQYRYRVRAADLLGRLSEPSPEVAIRAPSQRGPMPPPQLASAVTDGRIRIVWTVSPEPRTRGYHVERSVGGDSTFTRITRSLVDGETPEFTDTLVRGRQVYTYRVRAVDDAGRIGGPSNPTTTRGLDERPPAAPTSLTATVLSGHRVRLAWNAVPDRDVRGYDVLRVELGDTLFTRLTSAPIRATVYVDSGYDGARLEPGREYTWRVVAVDSSGNLSVPAALKLRLVDDEAPEPVRSILVHNQMGRHVDISWSGSPSLDVAGYLVERVHFAAPTGANATGATGATRAPATLIARVSSTGTFLVRDTTAEKGRVALWRVVAVDSAGNRAPPLGDTLTFRDLTRPPAPRRVTAIRSSGVTTVRWERVVSVDLRGYIVYRAERSDGPRTRLTATAVTALEFVDRAAPPGARYIVRAVDASGNESEESPVAAVVERP